MQNKMISEPSKECIASIAMYREMIEKNLDIYDILSQFINFIISDKKLNQFTAKEINNYLKEIFNYSIPEAAVKEALKNIISIKLDKNTYYLISEPIINKDFISIKEKLEIETNNVFNNIVNFIEIKHSKELNNQEKEIVFKEFYNFLLNNQANNKNYAKLISLWVLQNSNNPSIQNILNVIKEGILITCAFEYNPAEYKEKIWNTPLTLYFDIENLFSLEGLNGEPYKSLSNDLINLINECNKKSKKQYISLMYFSSVRQEIENYYNVAFQLLKKEKKAFQYRTAMANILNGCEYPSDVIEKKIRLLKTLNYKGFSEFDASKYEKEDFQYNIIDENTITILKNQFPRYNEDELNRVQVVLNKINHLRKGMNLSFYKCGHFFVTETGTMLNIALHSDILRPDSVPLATNIEYLTERIWSKTNSTFSKNKPKSVNAVVIAQLILSSQTNIVIREKYEGLKKRYKENGINEEEANEILVSLKKARDISQNISTSNVDNISIFLESSIEDEIIKQNDIKNKLEETEKKASSLENEKNEILKTRESEELERLQEENNGRKYRDNRQKILNKSIPIIIIFFTLAILTNFLGRFLNNEFIKLIIDIINIVGFIGCIVTGLIMFIKLRMLEKMKNSNW